MNNSIVIAHKFFKVVVPPEKVDEFLVRVEFYRERGFPRLISIRMALDDMRPTHRLN